MRLTLCKLCQFADRLASGSPVLVGIFSHMETVSFPTGLDPSFLALELESDPIEHGNDYRLDVRLIDEDGRVLAQNVLMLELPPSRDPIPYRTFVSLNVPWDRPILFERHGVYRFDVVLHRESGEEILGGETLIVHLRQNPIQEGPRD
ncbi:MAG: hypothetical protein KF784_14665 [Fimbriimonadaceae bacterium]|nr:hypothetical protein [Fimbriimonadaceae bacterium]